jgi:hypothetical protein
VEFKWCQEDGKAPYETLVADSGLNIFYLLCMEDTRNESETSF